ncbi:unnamed protein product [Ectocarpus sp. 12 AP-2014]
MFNDSQLLHKVVNGDLLGVQELVNAGVSANGNPRLLRDIPLILATVKGHIRIAEFLITRGANLESACLEDVVNENGEMSVRKGMRALHLSSSPEMTSVLLKAGACPNASDADGCTPLMRAVENPKPLAVGMVRELLKGKADPRLISKDGKMVLHFAVGAGNIDAVSCLLDAAPETLNHPALEYHITPLCFAATGGYVALADMLLSGEARTRPLIATKGRRNISCPLYVAVVPLREKFVELIVDKGMEAVGGMASIPAGLLAAAQFGLVNVVRMLIGVQGQGRQEYWANLLQLGWRVLTVAAGFNSLEVVILLVQAGASEGALDKGGKFAVDSIGSLLRSSIHVTDSPVPVKTARRDTRVRDPVREARIRSTLRQGPAFRARSWLWPPTAQGGEAAPTVALGNTVAAKRTACVRRPKGTRFFAKLVLERYAQKR